MVAGLEKSGFLVATSGVLSTRLDMENRGLDDGVVRVGVHYYNTEEELDIEKMAGAGELTQNEAISILVSHKEQRDALNRPLPGGLYDPKMGPTDHYETCTSCGLDYSLCPGHIGHIDLALPTYSPVLFQHMLKLLKSKCFNCHRFRADATKLQKLAHAAELDLHLLHALLGALEHRVGRAELAARSRRHRLGAVVGVAVPADPAPLGC